MDEIPLRTSHDVSWRHCPVFYMHRAKIGRSYTAFLLCNDAPPLLYQMHIHQRHVIPECALGIEQPGTQGGFTMLRCVLLSDTILSCQTLKVCATNALLVLGQRPDRLAQRVRLYFMAESSRLFRPARKQSPDSIPYGILSRLLSVGIDVKLRSS